MRKLTVLLLMIMLLCSAAVAEDALSIDAPDAVIRPGKAATISFTAPQAGAAEILLKDMQGQTISVVVEDFAAVQGINSLWWNGTYQGAPAPQGDYQLVVNLNGATAAAPVTVGANAPYLTSIDVSSTAVTPAVPVTVDFYASTEGTLTVGLLQGENHLEMATMPVVEGQQSYVWQTDLYTQIGLADGSAALTLMLTDGEDFNSNEEHIAVTLSGFVAVEPTMEVIPEAVEATPEPAAEPADAVEEAVVEEIVEAIIFDEDGNIVEEEPEATEEVTAENTVFTPALGSPYQPDEPLNYWNMPMDITDEAAVWEVLMQPMTILYSNVDRAERTQTVLRAEPSDDSEAVGLVTRMNQGVHVLETLDNGWSLIEAYSSSFYGADVKRWNLLVQGYVKTKELKVVEPQQEYGFVVDKLTQRLYIFKEGKLFTTLMISTGLVNGIEPIQPYNETRSGEFLLTSPVGDFASGNMTCDMGIRFNSGDLLHEVPHKINADGTRNYGYTEPLLGSKASHGCIRVQRRKTPEGINMTWIWNNRIRNTKLLIWEDWQGRQMDIPEDDFLLYYNPDGGSYYHSSSFCYMAPKRTFEPFTYGQLEEEGFAKLKRCTYCAPVFRRAEIEARNAEYAPGGDHNAVLTRVQQEQFEKEAKEAAKKND
ncbi:MAG: L,D-transpeptidase family protein [Clostridia bacterium]|nr:L,D-transpeptidase family protein [Clostridia bacterium]